jgi:hypothetical protein
VIPSSRHWWAIPFNRLFRAKVASILAGAYLKHKQIGLPAAAAQR